MVVRSHRFPDSACSKQFFSEAAKFPMTYYGQLSFNEINPGGDFELKDESFYDKDYEKEFNKNFST